MMASHAIDESQQFAPKGTLPTAQIFQLQSYSNNRKSQPYTVPDLKSDIQTENLPSHLADRSQDSTSRGMSMATESELRAAEISAAEARGETKIARLEGKIDTAVATLLGEMHAIRDDVRQSDQYQRDTRWVLLVSVVTVGLALGGLAVGLVTYGDALFGRGMNVRDVIQSTIKDYQATQPKQP